MEDGRYVVKPWALMEAQYGLLEPGLINLIPRWTNVAESRVPESRVIDVFSNHWEDFDGRKWSIVPEMLYGPYFDWGEECEVSDHGEVWAVAVFRGYAPSEPDDCMYIYATSDQGPYWYRYIRRPQKQQTSHKEAAEKYAKQYNTSWEQGKEICELGEISKAVAIRAYIAGRKSMESEGESK